MDLTGAPPSSPAPTAASAARSARRSPPGRCGSCSRACATRTPSSRSPGAEVRPVRLDLSSRESIDACVDALGDELAAVDLLVNNAGQMTGGLLEEQDMDEVYAMFQVNLVAVAHLTPRVLPHMLAARPRHDRQQRLDQRLRRTSPPPPPTPPPRPASSRSRSRCGASSRAPASASCTSSRRASTPTCSTRPRRSTAATWTPPAGTRSSPPSGRQKVLEAIEDDRHVLGPGGKTALRQARLARARPSCSTRSAAGCSAGSRGHSRRRRGRERVEPGAAAWRTPSARARSGARRSRPRSSRGTSARGGGSARRSRAPRAARSRPRSSSRQRRSVSA